MKDQIIYNLMLIGFPVLVAILCFIGGLAVNALIKMGKDINEIKVTLQMIITEHDGLKERVEKLEEKLYR